MSESNGDLERDVQKKNYDHVSDTYDELYDSSSPPCGHVVDYMSALMDAGRFLEVGVGTGRVAIPLARKANYVVHGIDPSPGMLAKLKDKDGGELVDTWPAGITNYDWDGTAYDVCYFINNVVYHALSESELVAWFTRSGEMLAPDGHLIVENYIDTAPYPDRELSMDGILNGVVYLKATQRNPITDVFDQAIIQIDKNELKSFPMQFKFYSAEDLDNIAGRCGFKLVKRDMGWQGREWSGAGWCVSRYMKNGNA